MSETPRATRWLLTALGAACLLLFARLALRHVGDSYFLADQVDQLQNFESLLRLRPEGLWGSIMSGTDARSLGPLGAIVFGLPVRVGLGIDAVHAVTSLLIAFATAVAFTQLAAINRALAFAWLLVFAMMRIVWWNAGMFWVCTLLLTFGLAMFALSTACLRRPSVGRLALLVLAQLLALQIHLVAIVGVPLVLVVMAVTGSAGLKRRPSRVATAVFALVIVAAFIPYVTGELMTGFHNTRAMWSHFDASVHAAAADGPAAARDTLIAAGDPIGLFGGQASLAIGAGSLIAAAALAGLFWRRRREAIAIEANAGPVIWLVAAALIGVAGQALFFRMMARPLNGLHYVTLLAPFYALPPAALIAALLPGAGRRWHGEAAAVLGLGVLVLLAVRGPVLADRYVEKTDWSYGHIRAAVDAICETSAQTEEGPGFVDGMNPSYDPVLRFLLKRHYTRCRFDPGSDVLLVANRRAQFEERLVRADGAYQREQVLPPGIARYRRVSR